jgi:hypothetical protein
MSKDKKFIGLFQGTVEDNKDPLMMGRLKIRVPSVYGDQTKISTNDLPWAVGMFNNVFEDEAIIGIPRINSLVFLEFIEGDSSSPIYFNTSTSLFKELGNPILPGEIYNGYTSRLVIKRAGNTIVLDDDESSITLKHGGTFISLNGKTGAITLMSKSGAYIEINGNVTVYPKIDTPSITANSLKGGSVSAGNVAGGNAPCLSGGGSSSPSCKPPSVSKNISEGNPTVNYDNGSRTGYSGTSYKK